MNSFEVNKVLGAVLGALLFAAGSGFVAELIYHPKPAGNAGYDLPEPQPEAAAAAPEAEAGPRAAAPASGDLLDAEILDGLLGLGDGAFVDRIVDLYRRQAPDGLAVLRSALAAGNQPGIARAAHSLRSMSANIGARALVGRLGAIEQAARAGTCTEPPAACDGLAALLDATVRDLDLRTHARQAA